MINSDEVIAARAEKLVTLIVWIDRDVPPDPHATAEFNQNLCDLVAPNRGTLEEFHRRLAALARWAGLLRV